MFKKHCNAQQTFGILQMLQAIIRYENHSECITSLDAYKTGSPTIRIEALLFTAFLLRTIPQTRFLYQLSPCRLLIV